MRIYVENLFLVYNIEYNNKYFIAIDFSSLNIVEGEAVHILRQKDKRFFLTTPLLSSNVICFNPPTPG